jgi:hypothetical protein
MERSIIARRYGGIAASVGITLFLAACGGGSDSDMSSPASPTDCSNAADCGGVMIGITDADGDFVRYAVAIESLTLDRQDGAEIETLPATVTIDLAQFTDVTELFTSATVPRGVYTGAHLRIDYSNADIAVERSGETVAAVAVDPNGDPLTTVDVDVTLDELSRLMVQPGAPVLLGIDFDLAASNSVDLTTTPVTVTAQPFLLAEVNPADGKTLHAAGGLVSADTSNDSYDMHLRPFYHRNSDFGAVTLHVDDATTYEINGTPFSGAEGLAALAQLPAGTPTLAKVVESVADHALNAVTVLAGSSVPGADLDAVEGWVSSRDGDVLQLHAVTVVPNGGDVTFSDDFEVQLASDVSVRESGSLENALDASAISVGQRIVASGSLGDTASSNPSLEASNVRLLETTVAGEASSVEPFVMNVDAFDFQSPANFSFSGTGSSIENDADPAAYEIDTGNLSLANVEVGTPLHVVGMVAPFGAAPPDFVARTVIDVSAAAWRLDVAWPDGSTAPFASLEPGSIVLDLSDPALGNIHTLRRGGVLTNLDSLPASPAIVPARPSNLGIYGIWQNGEIQVFLDFKRFVTELTARLNNGASVLRMHAIGDYDEGGNSFDAQRITIQLQ